MKKDCPPHGADDNDEVDKNLRSRYSSQDQQMSETSFELLQTEEGCSINSSLSWETPGGGAVTSSPTGSYGHGPTSGDMTTGWEKEEEVTGSQTKQG